MFTLFFSFLGTLRSCFQTRAALQLEILALRHQINVVVRQNLILDEPRRDSSSPQLEKRPWTRSRGALRSAKFSQSGNHGAGARSA